MAKLHFITAAMNAGKTTNLIQAAYNYKEQGLETICMKPSIDNREGSVPKIISRTGLECDAVLFDKDVDLFKYVLETMEVEYDLNVQSRMDRQGIEQEYAELGFKRDLRVFLEVARRPACILIDECQFMTVEQVRQVTDIVDYLDIPVMCYGLRSDFQGKGFPASIALWEAGARMRECRGICHCNQLSTHVLRVDENGVVVKEGAQVQVGGNDSYVSVCRLHHKEGIVA